MHLIRLKMLWGGWERDDALGLGYGVMIGYLEWMKTLHLQWGHFPVTSENNLIFQLTTFLKLYNWESFMDPGIMKLTRHIKDHVIL